MASGMLALVVTLVSLTQLQRSVDAFAAASASSGTRGALHPSFLDEKPVAVAFPPVLRLHTLCKRTRFASAVGAERNRLVFKQCPTMDGSAKDLCNA